MFNLKYSIYKCCYWAWFLYYPADIRLYVFISAISLLLAITFCRLTICCRLLPAFARLSCHIPILSISIAQFLLRSFSPSLALFKHLTYLRLTPVDPAAIAFFHVRFHKVRQGRYTHTHTPIVPVWGLAWPHMGQWCVYIYEYACISVCVCVRVFAVSTCSRWQLSVFTVSF